MGEIADSLINGEFDYISGEYIGEPCGYPRTYDRSLTWERPGQKSPAITGNLPLPLGGAYLVGKRVIAFVRISGVWRQAYGEITEYGKEGKFRNYVGYKFVRQSNKGNTITHVIRFSQIVRIQA